MTKDMTQGSPWRQIFLFSLPLLLGNVFQQLYSMVDTIIVGRFVSVNALAAVGSTGAISFLILGFAMGMTGGFAVIIAQRFGAGDEESVKRAIGTSVILSIVTTAVLTVGAIATSRPLMELMNTPQDIMEDALLYIRIIYLGIGASIYYNMIASIVRALGDSRTPLYFLIFSSILNIILDLVLILNFKMGVAGAAVATIISQLVSAVLCTLYSVRKFSLLRLSKHHLKKDSMLMRAELNVGLPMAFQFSITAIGVMVLQSALNNFGSSVIASYTAATKVETLVSQPFVALGMTMTTYCGQNVGAQRWDRVRKGVNISVAMCMAAALFAMAVTIFGGRWCTALFITNPSEEILSYAQTYLTTAGLFYPVLGLLSIYRSALQGMGDGVVPLLGGVGELVARIVVATILPPIIGYLGVCLAAPSAWCLATAILLIRYFPWIHQKKKEEKLKESV